MEELFFEFSKFKKDNFFVFYRKCCISLRVIFVCNRFRADAIGFLCGQSLPQEKNTLKQY